MRPFSDFTYISRPGTIVFGNGSSLTAGEWVEQLGCRKALVLTTPQQSAEGESLAARLGPLCTGTFAEATMHTPIDVTLKALASVSASGVDCLVALGGGSTTGLGKAIAWRTDLPQIVIPTTYAGSEVTDILGETVEGQKRTMRDPRVLPKIVLYDPRLTVGLGLDVSLTSALNAMAHAAEALYAPDRHPISDLMAVEGLRALRDALPLLVQNPRDLSARESALYGAWLCGTVLGMITMSLHHKICHTLGGSFGLPHAQTHAVMLPHTIAFNEKAVPERLAPIAKLFGGKAGVGLWLFAKNIGAPLALADLGLAENELNRAAELATADPYANPRPIDTESVRSMLQAAWEGTQPDE